jgi:hypothetical protein
MQCPGLSLQPLPKEKKKKIMNSPIDKWAKAILKRRIFNEYILKC